MALVKSLSEILAPTQERIQMKGCKSYKVTARVDVRVWLSTACIACFSPMRLFPEADLLSEVRFLSFSL